MRKFAAILVSVVVVQFGVSAGENQIAKIKFRDIEDLLTERALSRPGNEKLKEFHEAATKKKNEMQMNLQKEALSGKMDPMKYARQMMPMNMADKKKVDELAEAELIDIIETVFPNKYKLILRDSFGGGVLYTSITIPDITQNVKQHLLKLKITEPVK